MRASHRIWLAGQHLSTPSLSFAHRTLFTSSSGLEHAKQLVTQYKTGHVQGMTPELWQAKKVIDSMLHPGKTQRIHESDIRR